MGNLLGSWRFKEPSTVEECDSTWGSDSESEEPATEDDSGISDSSGPAESDRAAGIPEDGSPQLTESPKSFPKMKRSFYAARDLYKYRHSYPVHTHTHTHVVCVLLKPSVISVISVLVELQKVPATQRVPQPALLPEQDPSST